MRIKSIFKDQTYLSGRMKWTIIALAVGPPLLCILIALSWALLFFFLLALPQVGWMLRCFHSKDSMAITCGGIVGADIVLLGMIVYMLCNPKLEEMYWILYWPMAACAVLIGALIGKIVDIFQKRRMPNRAF